MILSNPLFYSFNQLIQPSYICWKYKQCTGHWCLKITHWLRLLKEFLLMKQSILLIRKQTPWFDNDFSYSSSLGSLLLWQIEIVIVNLTDCSQINYICFGHFCHSLDHFQLKRFVLSAWMYRIYGIYVNQMKYLLSV